MTRSLPWILAGTISISGCAGPIETRVQTHQLIAAAGQKQFALSPKEAPENHDLAMARDLVTKALSTKGYQSSPEASLLVHVGLAARPADIAIDGGDKNAARSIADAKHQKRFQSCKDKEYRLTVSLFDQIRGAKLYSGNAAEHHCNGTIAQSLPFLIDSALSGLDGDPSETRQSTIRTRQGVE